MAIGIFFDEFHISQDGQKLKEFILIDGVARYFREAYVYDNSAYESLWLEYGLWLPGTDYYYRKLMKQWSEEALRYFMPIHKEALFIRIDSIAEGYPHRILLETKAMSLNVEVREECCMDKVKIEKDTNPVSRRMTDSQKERLIEWNMRLGQKMFQRAQEEAACQKTGKTDPKKKKEIS